MNSISRLAPPRLLRAWPHGPLALAVAALTAACGGGGAGAAGDSSATASSSAGGGSGTPAATAATGTVKCNISDSGTQRLVYSWTAPGLAATPVDETLSYQAIWSCDSSTRLLTGNGVPNHAVTGGAFATKVSAQSISASFTLAPSAGSTTQVAVPGYAMNGVKFDPATAGTCPASATSDANCNYAMGSDAWRMEALPGSVSPWQFDFGTDSSNAHVQPNGQYHYHGMPEGLMATLAGAGGSSMQLVGWANDGFPIYARYGHTDATDASSALKSMSGSYRVKASPDAGRPSTTYFPMGHFQQDWEYVAGYGDLDECNGRTGVTPEFPDGIYHYFVTDTYPFVQRCVKGAL
ncbi:MAG: YHYH protein [Burkholderiaceae bacterium]|nr:YHYH protein [Burkholderiaceae bacterium]